MVKQAWHYSWSSARAHLGNRYKIIELADIKEYIDIKCWREYLTERENQASLIEVREKTRKGLIWGPTAFIQRIEEKLNRRLIAKPRGRPKNEKNSVCT